MEPTTTADTSLEDLKKRSNVTAHDSYGADDTELANALPRPDEPHILDRAAKAMSHAGLVGEEKNRRLVFLATVGGLLGDPIHLIVHGPSSAGKNQLVRSALKLLPNDRVLAVSGLSSKALSYYEDDVIDGILFIDEAEGQRGAEYQLRIAMSEGEVTRLTTEERSQGGFGASEKSVKVDASIITTTTETSLHPENQTRVFDLQVDDSVEQTRRVLGAKARAAAGRLPSDPSEIIDHWPDALDKLEPVQVRIPFAEDLAEDFPGSQTRARRDFPRCLALIRSHARLHQRQRDWIEDGEIAAELSDYAAIRPLLQHALKRTLSGLSDTALKLCDLHDELVKEADDEWVKRKDLETEAGKRDIASRNTVHKWCKRLSQIGVWEGDRRGSYRAWHHRKLRDPRGEPIDLPTVSELRDPVEHPIGSTEGGGRRMSDGSRDSDTPPTNESMKASESESQDSSRPSEDDSLFAGEDWEAEDDPDSIGAKPSHQSDVRALGEKLREEIETAKPRSSVEDSSEARDEFSLSGGSE